MGAFQYMKAKGAIKDIGKILNIPFEITNTMTAQFENETIREVLDLGLLDKYRKQYPELFIYAERLAGLPKSFGVHPCFTANTMILTNYGYKRIIDVQIGDKVLTHNANYKLVVNKTINKGDTIKVKHISGFDIECTPNHPFYVKHRTCIKPKKYSEPEWIEAKNIVKSDMVCMPINTNSIIAKYKNLSTNKKEFWWLIGKYMGDGWCLYFEQPRNTKSVVICCDNHGYSEITEIISHLNNIFDFRYEYNKTTYKIFIKNIFMVINSLI